MGQTNNKGIDKLFKKISKYRYFAKLYSRNTRSTVLEKVDTDFRQQYDAFQYSIKSSQKAPFES